MQGALQTRTALDRPLHLKRPKGNIVQKREKDPDKTRLGDKGGSGGGLVLEGGGNGTLGLVVTGKTVDTGLDKNEAELGVHVLAVALKVLADGNGLLDEVVKVLRDLRSKTLRLEDTEDLVTGDETDLGNTLRVTELNTDLRGGHTLTGELDNLLDNLLGGGLEPRGGSAAVGQSRSGDTLSLGWSGAEWRKSRVVSVMAASREVAGAGSRSMQLGTLRRRPSSLS